MAKESVTSKGAGWEWAHSLWILWTIVSLGWIAFLYVGIRVRRPLWIVWGIVYFILYIIGSSGTSTFASIVFLIAFVVPIVNAFRIRKEYLVLLAQKQAENSRVDTVQNTQPNDRRYEPLKQTQSEKDYPRAGGEVKPPPLPNTVANESSDAQVSLPTSPQEQLIDLNSASEAQLASLPGIGPIIAKRANALREQGRRFASAEDFGEALNITSHNVERLKPLVTVADSSRETNQGTEKGSSGRIVDF